MCFLLVRRAWGARSITLPCVCRFTPLLLAAVDGTVDTCELDYGAYKLPLWTNPNGETAGRKCILNLGLISTARLYTCGVIFWGGWWGAGVCA